MLLGHGPELVVLLLALLVFGPGKLPEMGAALGHGIREFKDATAGNPSSPSPMLSPTAARPAQQIVVGREPAESAAAPAEAGRDPAIPH